MDTSHSDESPSTSIPETPHFTVATNTGPNTQIDEATQIGVETMQQRTRKVPVIEIFGPTIQGEGEMIGWRTMFVRFGGCDYRCKMCDSLHAVMPAAIKVNATRMNLTEIADKLLMEQVNTGVDWVTFSGGNPAMWELGDLVDELHLADMAVAVETQGTLWKPWLKNVDMLTVSPKAPGMGEKFEQDKFMNFMGEVQETGVPLCVKVPIFNQLDIEFAVGIETILRDMSLNEGVTRYLSVGNSHPPTLNPDMTLKVSDDTMLVGALLNDYAILLDQFLIDRRLSGWRFTPQLHVLLWGNKAGV